DAAECRGINEGLLVLLERRGDEPIVRRLARREQIEPRMRRQERTGGLQLGATTQGFDQLAQDANTFAAHTPFPGDARKSRLLPQCRAREQGAEATIGEGKGGTSGGKWLVLRPPCGIGRKAVAVLA